MKQKHFKLPLYTIALLFFLNFFKNAEFAFVLGSALVIILGYALVTIMIKEYLDKTGLAISIGIFIILIMLIYS